MVWLAVKNLEEDQFGAVYPLVRIAAPRLSLDDWRHFARRLMSGQGGIITVSSGDGSPHGIAIYRVDYSLRHGRTLEVELIVTFELNRQAPARAALCEMLELIAYAKDCETLMLSTASKGYAASHSPKADLWAGLGLDVDSVVFTKPLTMHPGDSPGEIHN
jgi:hypothetical protein